MLQKPYVWNAAPALVEPGARAFWKGLAFLAPLWGGAGKGALLGSHGGPVNVSLASANVLWRATPYGVGLGSSSASDMRRLSANNFCPITTSDGVGTGDFTILQLVNPSAGATGAVQVTLGHREPAGALNTACLTADSNASQAYTSGSFQFGSYASGWSGVAATGMADGKWHVFTGVRRNGVMELWRDGVLAASASLTVRNVYSATANFCIGGYPASTSFGLATAADIGVSGGWNRALSAAEIRLLARDPFCMLRPSPEWRGVWTPLGGTATLSPADLTDGFGFETPVFSQVHALAAPGMRFAESLDAAGFSQAHLFSVSGLNSAFWLDAATLATGMSNAPEFRSRSPVHEGRGREISGISRVAPVGSDGRTRSITE